MVKDTEKFPKTETARILSNQFCVRLDLLALISLKDLEESKEKSIFTILSSLEAYLVQRSRLDR